jgi:hypothetical protein
VNISPMQDLLILEDMWQFASCKDIGISKLNGISSMTEIGTV